MSIKRISILGSTGSIGKSALSVIHDHKDKFKVVGLCANRDIETLKEQILLFRPALVGVADEESAQELCDWVSDKFGHHCDGTPITVLPGERGVCAVAAHEYNDFVISAIVGAAGLKPTLAAIRAGKTIGLANKETLVMAGDFVMSEIAKHKARLLPVDSEHSAIFQCLEGRNMADVSRLILTASGGPFLGRKRDDLEGVSVADALKHPNWSMGSKITVDSATLMNKGLEVIEAHYLFGKKAPEIDVVIHPQSIVHSLVEFRDGSLMAQLSLPDMKGPIAYALSYPRRIEGVLKRCRLEEISTLTFATPDMESFPCLKCAYEALREGGTMPAVLNAANEALVHLFLNNKTGFNRIPEILKRVMDKHKKEPAKELEVIFEADRWARQTVLENI